MKETKPAIIEVEGGGVAYRLMGQRTLKSHFFGWLRREQPELFWALRDVDIRVNEGEIVAIIGRNGSGKSTLLQMLVGTLEPSAGSVSVRGTPTPLLSLQFGGHPELTGLENIDVMGLYLGLSPEEIAAITPSVVEFSELGRFIYEPLRGFSSGMIGRLGFALAVNLDPDILLLDEILGVGDDAFRKKCCAAMDELLEKSRVIVAATHSLPFVRDTCTRAVWLDSGRVVMDGAPGEVATAYESFLEAGVPATVRG